MSAKIKFLSKMGIHSIILVLQYKFALVLFDKDSIFLDAPLNANNSSHHHAATLAFNTIPS